MYCVTKAANFANLLEQTRRHPAAKHTGEYLQAVKLIIANRQSLQRHGDMHLFEVARFDFCATAEMCRLRFGSTRSLECCQTLVDFRHDRLVLDSARGSHHHVG